MKSPLNLLALLASFLMAFGSTVFEFLDHYHGYAMAVSLVGIALGCFCVKTAKLRNYYLSSTPFGSHLMAIIITLGIFGIGVPELFSETISHWKRGMMLTFIIADTICMTSFLYLIWHQIRKRPEASKTFSQ
jgi:hypothetical protein